MVSLSYALYLLKLAFMMMGNFLIALSSFLATIEQFQDFGPSDARFSIRLFSVSFPVAKWGESG